MSLILTKSTPGHPASYVNRFKNTFEIKANAEIAVQEVVINRSKKFVVGPDARLYVRHGDAANVNEWNVPQVVALVAGTYDPTEMAAHLQQQLNAYESHPQWQGNWTCAATQVAGEFAKFTIASVQATTASSALPTAANLTLLFGNKPPTTTPTYDASTGIVTSNGNVSTWSSCISNHPLSLNDGQFTVKITGSTSKMRIGLHCNNLYNPAKKTAVHPAYQVAVDTITDGGTVEVFSVLRINEGENRNTLVPLEYNDGTVLQVTSTDNHITFMVENDIVKVYMGTAADPKKTLIIDDMLPVCTRTYALYPFIQMRDSSEAQFVTYTPIQSFDPQASVFQLNDGNARRNVNEALEAATDNYQSAESSLRKGLAANLLVSSTSLIVNPYNAYTWDANMAEELGFDTANVTPSTTAGGTETFASNSVPDRSGSDEIMYVRLTGLTFASHNGVTGGPSRILQPLARFTDNKTFGRMHFVPPQRTYLKLHNPSRLTVQEVQVDIVNSDEQVVGDLLGHTFVSLHVK